MTEKNGAVLNVFIRTHLKLHRMPTDKKKLKKHKIFKIGIAIRGLSSFLHSFDDISELSVIFLLNLSYSDETEHNFN